MSKSLIQLCSLLLILANLATLSNCSHHHPPRASAALFVFGDSLFDPGNNNFINTTTDFQANFPPYGETFFKHPTGRFCDGRLIPDFIAGYAKLPLIPPYLHTVHKNNLAYGVNFASAGAGALDGTYSGYVINFKMQLSFFKNVLKKLRLNLGKREAKQLVSNAVYLFHIGSNDYLNTNSGLFTLYTPEEYATMVVGNITAIFEEIYDQGGRKFGVLSLGTLGCLPFLRALNLSAGGNGDCVEQANAVAKLHNLLLSQQLQKLQKQLKGFKYSYFDLFDFDVEVIGNPSKYGFKEVKSGCCGSGPFRGTSSCGGKRGIKEYELCNNPQEYFFFDSSHPTEASNELTAKVMWTGPPNITGPYNYKTLFQPTEASNELSAKVMWTGPYNYKTLFQLTL